MMEHPSRRVLLLYAEGDGSIDCDSIAVHLNACAACAAIVTEVQSIALVLTQSAVWESPEYEIERKALRAELFRDAEAQGIADALLDTLLRAPEPSLEQLIETHPEYLTAGVARGVLATAEAKLDSDARDALRLIDIVERIADRLLDPESRAVLGDVWKQRANAFRHLARYQEALEAVDIAAAFYESLTAGDFDLAQARHTRAAILFKMMRFVEADEVLTNVVSILTPYGATLPLAKAWMLQAAILIEQGDIKTAAERWKDALPMLQTLGEEIEQARVLANLAECDLRLGHLEEALGDARRAVKRYRTLGMDSEALRSEWSIAVIQLARGESDAGIDGLMNAAAAFEARGMVGDAGYVKLDLCAEYLRRRDWSEAETTARELAGLFTKLGVTVAGAAAIEYLRQAVKSRQASVDTVQYIRGFIGPDSAASAFVPPSLSA